MINENKGRPRRITAGTRWLFSIPLLAPFCALGLGVRIADQDALATARGNAFAATADNPSAIYYNPAGITQLEGLQASYGLYGIYLNSDFKSPTGVHASTKDELQGVPHFYATYRFSDLPLAAGIGLYTPYGLGLEWPDNTGFRTLATEGRILYMTLNPIIAWEILPSLSVAAGPTINYSQAELKRGLGFAPGDEFKFKGDDIDVGYSIGLLWHPYPRHSLGASYRSATTLAYDGSTKLSPFGTRLDASTRFRFPQNVVAGWSFRPTPSWNLEVNVDWTAWEDLGTLTLNQSNGQQLDLPFNWRSSFFYEFGATYVCECGITISGGYIYSENSVPDSSFNPAVPDSDRHIFSLGVGGSRKRLRWDAAYQLAWGPSRTVSGSPTQTNPVTLVTESADGTYAFISHALTVSLGYRF
jgi:long-chain fatty acid transport protein